MKIVLEREKCIGCGSCVAICPKHFQIGDDGKSELLKGESIQKKEIEKSDCSQEAVECCPVQCISIDK